MASDREQPREILSRDGGCCLPFSRTDVRDSSPMSGRTGVFAESTTSVSYRCPSKRVRSSLSLNDGFQSTFTPTGS